MKTLDLKKEWKDPLNRQRVPGESLNEFIRIHLEWVMIGILRMMHKITRLHSLFVPNTMSSALVLYRNKLASDEHPPPYRT